MTPPRTLVLAAFCAGLVGSLAGAQTPTEIHAEYRFGQTFLTWRELSASGTRYRVYRADGPTLTAQDLQAADLLGEVDDRTSRNQGRSLASGNETYWIVREGGVQLDVDQGLFVHTIDHGTRLAHYAVTSVHAGVENTTLIEKVNSTRNPLFERPAQPQPVTQASDATGTVYAHWFGNRDTPFQPALSPWPSQGFNFRFEPGTAAGAHGLCVRLHAAGQTYNQGWPQRFEVPQDVDILALSDLQAYTGWTFWFGAQELLPAAPAPDSRVWNYTQERILWTVDRLAERLGPAHDPERLYAVGGSMGAIGSMYLAEEHPERFAAVLARNGLYDLLATDYRNPGIFESLFGNFALGLLTRAGIPITLRTNGAYMANLDPRVEWPVIRTINGRNDETVGWSSAVEFIHGLAQAERPAVHYFDERTHMPQGYWEDLERVLLTRTFQTRRDRPSLRFDGCTLDDDVGDGQRTDGDPIGALNAYLEYDPKTASATSDALDFDVYLRDQGLLDDAPAPTGWAALTPRRMAPFTLAPGDCVRYTLRANDVLVDEHLLFADAFGLVHTPLVPLDTTRRAAHFEHLDLAAQPPLFLGAAPIPGDDLQAVLHGAAGSAWTLYLALGDASGPFVTIHPIIRHGTFPPEGHAECWIGLPADLVPGTWIWGRALLASGLTSPIRVALQSWP